MKNKLNLNCYTPKYFLLYNHLIKIISCIRCVGLLKRKEMLFKVLEETALNNSEMNLTSFEE